MGTDERLKAVYHVSTRRLFDSCWSQDEFHLDEWESSHLADCQVCTHIRDVFARQYTAMKARVGDNEVA
jgi:hypothetical protein